MKRLNKKLGKTAGFTLVEMLIVVAIIAILVAVSIPLVSSSLENARERTDEANERAAKAEAIIMYLNGDLDSQFKDGKVSLDYDAENGTLEAQSARIAVVDEGEGEGEGTAPSYNYGKCSVHSGGYITVTVYKADGSVVITWSNGGAAHLAGSGSSGSDPDNPDPDNPDPDNPDNPDKPEICDCGCNKSKADCGECSAESPCGHEGCQNVCGCGCNKSKADCGECSAESPCGHEGCQNVCACGCGQAKKDCACSADDPCEHSGCSHAAKINQEFSSMVDGLTLSDFGGSYTSTYNSRKEYFNSAVVPKLSIVAKQYFISNNGQLSAFQKDFAKLYPYGYSSNPTADKIQELIDNWKSSTNNWGKG